MIQRSLASYHLSPKDPLEDHEILADLSMHRDYVRRIMDELVSRLSSASWGHDHTLSSYFKEYAEGEKDKQQGRDNAWHSTMHATAERHHLDISVPDNVNLLDVIEYLVERNVDAYQRTGAWPDPASISSEVLEKAVRNTEVIIDTISRSC